ncbi:MAG: bifunctional metallophosphatase/5'-nucleotidase [Chromatiaceae bacterium]|nr:MAG: bifunctional metallophosphatase/5'-nucleotidase [Chromatiaceae bacterium]
MSPATCLTACCRWRLPLALLLASLLAAACVQPGVDPADGDGDRRVGPACAPGAALTLLHFNDFHGQLAPYTDPEDQTERGGIARLAATLDQIRAEDPQQPVVLLFAGDLLQGTMTSSLFLGLPDVLLFERMGVAAAVLGNHELDYGQDQFRRLAAAVGFPFLAANVVSAGEPLPLVPWVRLTPPGAPAIAVLGLTTPELLTTTHPRNTAGLQVTDPVAVARQWVPRLQSEGTMVVVLSHMGIADDRRLAQTVSGIDLIIGGHNHHRYAQPVLVAGVPIVQAGERGGWLGRMDLQCRDGHLQQTAYRLLPIDATRPEDAEMAAEVRRIVAAAEQELDQPVGVSSVELSAARGLIRRTEAPFGNLLADLARDLTGAEVALFNGGGFRASIPAGPVTLQHVYQAFPFRNELVVGKLSGAQLQAALARSAALDPADDPGGFLQVSGVRYAIAAGRLASASVAGAPLDPQRPYRVVTSDFLAAGGDGYAMLAELANPVPTGRLISDLLIDAFRHQSPLAAHTDGRIERR